MSTATTGLRITYKRTKISCPDKESLVTATQSALAAAASALVEPVSNNVFIDTGFFPLVVDDETVDAWIQGVNAGIGGILTLSVEYVAGPSETSFTEIMIDLISDQE